MMKASASAASRQWSLHLDAPGTAFPEFLLVQHRIEGFQVKIVEADLVAEVPADAGRGHGKGVAEASGLGVGHDERDEHGAPPQTNDTHPSFQAGIRQDSRTSLPQ